MKYDMSKIMKRAWELVKTMGMNISEGLKKAWKEAKNMVKSLKEKVAAEIENLIADAADVYDYRISEGVWEKYGKNRTYFKVIETRKNSKHYVSYDMGYIDNNTEKYIAGKIDVFGKFGLNGMCR